MCHLKAKQFYRTAEGVKRENSVSGFRFIEKPNTTRRQVSHRIMFHRKKYNLMFQGR